MKAIVLLLSLTAANGTPIQNVNGNTSVSYFSYLATILLSSDLDDRMVSNGTGCTVFAPFPEGTGKYMIDCMKVSAFSSIYSDLAIYLYLITIV